MITTERIIEEARLSTNIDSEDAVSDKLCVIYLNRIQSHIQDIITNTNTESRFFKGNAVFQLTPGYDTYQLPFDIYNRNAINTVQIRYSSGSNYSYMSLRKISEKRRGQETGYFVYDDKIVLTPNPLTSDTILISYQKKLPKLGLRLGNIVSVIGNTVTFTNNIGKKISDSADYFSTIDSSGNIVTYANKVVSDTLTSVDVSDSTGIVAGQTIIAGDYSCNISRLPDECEKLLTYMLERMMLARLSSKDLQLSSLFTDEILSQLKNVFQENSGDVFTPPTPEWSEWM